MKILLINVNPVVSRLLALCTRDEEIMLDEVKSIDSVEDTDYDLVFVDNASYVSKVDGLLTNKRFRKKVFISYDEEPVEGFDLNIKKPFLPSQIIDVIQSIDMSEEVNKEDEEILSFFSDDLEEEHSEADELPPIFPLARKESKEKAGQEEETAPEVLDSKEIEKIKALLDMDDEAVEERPISEDEVEAHKVKVIKEHLIADGLEIIEEDAMVEALSAITQSAAEKEEKINKTQKKSKKKETLFSKKELSRIEAAVEVALNKMKPKKMQKLLKGKKIEIKIKLEDEL